jgi:hypothetical protein
MATYSYDITVTAPLTQQQIAAVAAAGSLSAVPESVRLAADAATRDLARSTFGSSFTEGSGVRYIQDGNYISSTQITSPAEVAAALLPPGIAPVAGDINRLVEARTPVTTEDTPLSPLTPIVNTAGPVVPGPVIETPPAPVQPIVVPTPVATGDNDATGGAGTNINQAPPNINPVPVDNDATGGAGTNVNQAPPITQPAAVPPGDNDATGGAGTNVNQALPDNNNPVVPGLTNSAKNQSTLLTRENLPTSADWRVRLSLAQNATYLYKANAPGILKPLANTNGVIFPYTPTIETSYQAKYDPYDLTHSNYRGYFYKNSSVENITVKGTFTAQDTKEAEYLLAVIHFFKSVTKMFYGQDAEAGTPPPLVYLNGFGKNQFNNHPCVVSNFTYNLPNDVDYIRADGFNNIGLNLQNRRTQSSGPGPGGSLGTVMAIIDRLKNAGLPKGGIGYVSDAEQTAQMNQAAAATKQNSTNSTYVPTMMEISITLLPIQTRNQVSKQFSLEGFANGTLLTKGFW